MKKHASPGGHKTIAQNRRARFDYEILETFEAGLVLTGAEVKSTKAGGLNLSGSYVAFHGDTPTLIGARISPYAFSPMNDDPERSRDLLLHKEEIDHLRGATQEQGRTLIPLRAYLKRGLIKLEVGIGRGKRMGDKRSVIRERDIGREAEREITDRAKKRQ